MQHREHPRRILLATDFSENAAAATTWAAKLAGEYGSRLIVVHAFLPNSPPDPEFITLPPQYFEALRSSAQQNLEDETSALRRRGLDVGEDLVIGPAVDGVLQAAARHDADLIVVGTRGRTGWKKLLLGSTAAKIVRDAPCPVLTVTPHAHDPRPFHIALVATDFSEEASFASKAATRLLWRVGTHKLVLLHVYRVPSEVVELPVGMMEEAIRSGATKAGARLREGAAELGSPDVVVEPMGMKGYPPEVILEQAATLGVDLIAMGTRGRSGLNPLVLGSTARSVIALAPCPVLTVRSSKEG
jgi:nucleotide-binding universal stress UspA family protein